MERPEYLIDTNVVIDYLGKKLPYSGMEFMNGIVDAIPKVSVITKIEVLGFNATEHSDLLINFMDDAEIIDLTGKVIDESINIRKSQKTKLPDVIIAATALVHKLILVSRNVSDFKNIKGLRVVNPHNLQNV